MPGITAAGSLSGNARVFPGLSFLGTFTPTYSGYTTFSASFYISGWSATRSRGATTASALEIGAGYQPNYGSFNLLAQAEIVHDERLSWRMATQAARLPRGSRLQW